MERVVTDGASRRVCMGGLGQRGSDELIVKKRESACERAGGRGPCISDIVSEMSSAVKAWAASLSLSPSLSPSLSLLAAARVLL